MSICVIIGKIRDINFLEFVSQGFENSSADQSISDARGLCLQNLWPGKKAWKFNHLHHVLACHIVQHLDAIILLFVRFHQIRDFS